MGDRLPAKLPPEDDWEFRYLGISAECDLARQTVDDNFDGWEFVSFCHQTRERQWFCVFKRPLPAAVAARRNMAA